MPPLPVDTKPGGGQAPQTTASANEEKAALMGYDRYFVVVKVEGAPSSCFLTRGRTRSQGKALAYGPIGVSTLLVACPLLLTTPLTSFPYSLFAEIRAKQCQRKLSVWRRPLSSARENRTQYKGFSCRVGKRHESCTCSEVGNFLSRSLSNLI